MNLPGQIVCKTSFNTAARSLMSKKKKPKGQQETLISLKEAMYLMRVAPIHMDQWIREHKVVPRATSSGPALRLQDFKKLAHSKDALDGALDGLANHTLRREADEASGKTAIYLRERAQIIAGYRKDIDTIEAIHRKYHDRLNVLTNQTPKAAAYIITAKVITLLKMACLCLENVYWESNLLLRPIDEALQLAEYFMVTADTQVGKKHLSEWFRENKSPPNSVCREAIELYMRNLTPAIDDDMVGEVMRQLYHTKSKPVHNAFNNIMEVYRTRMDGQKLIGVGFDYGPCSFPRKFNGLLHFYRSSIWTTVQTFMICFNVGDTLLEPADADILDNLNNRFLAEIDKGKEGA